jgi:transcriptional regulator with XRE-family HTH domain
MTGPELKRLIKQQGYTQAGLAKEIGIDPRTMRKYISEELDIPKPIEIAIRCVINHEAQ